MQQPGSTTSPRHCAGCGAFLGTNALFCTACGRPVGTRGPTLVGMVDSRKPPIRKFIDPLPVGAQPNPGVRKQDRLHTRSDEPPRGRLPADRAQPQIAIREGLRAGSSTVVIESGLGDAASVPALKSTLFLPGGDVLSITLGSEKDRLILGRDPEHCALVVDDPRVSRQHLAIGVRGAIGYVQDLGSANGTFVNGERLTVRRDLHDGDIVRLGQTEFGYREG